MDSTTNDTLVPQTSQVDPNEVQKEQLTTTAEDTLRKPFMLFLSGGYDMPKRSRFEAVREWAKHPLVLLILGALATSYIFPLIISRSDEAKQTREARLRRAEEIWNLNQDLNIKLAKLAVLITVFDNRKRAGTPTELKQAQTDFKKDYLERYLAVEEAAWWWPWDIERKESLRRDLSVEELARLKTFVSEYEDSVEKSVSALTVAYRCVVSNEDALNKDHSQCVQSMRGELGMQYGNRADLVMKISRLLAEAGE